MLVDSINKKHIDVYGKVHVIIYLYVSKLYANAIM